MDANGSCEPMISEETLAGVYMYGVYHNMISCKKGTSLQTCGYMYSWSLPDIDSALSVPSHFIYLQNILSFTFYSQTQHDTTFSEYILSFIIDPLKLYEEV